MRRSTLVVALAAALWGLLAAIGTGTALAVTPFKDIASAGPLEHVYLGDELSCQIDHTADTLLQFFPAQTIPGDCGTFVAVGQTLYAPDFVAHGSTATGNLGVYIPFTPVSQTNVTGTGTAADPFRVGTVADLGLSGLRIQQTDSYVVGDEAYRTDVAITNSSSLAQSGVLYRAGDCFLGGSDVGFGFTETFGERKAVGCSVNANNTPVGRIEEWVPLTGGNNFFQARFSAVWGHIATKTAFPDTCACAISQDNGAGISWSFTVPAAGSITFSHITTFSPTGKEALETSKTADSPTSTAGSQNGYTITVGNSNPEAVTLDSIVDTLPAGFSYVPNSTTGVTTANPAINGQTLTWGGPLVVPGNGSASLHFFVTVASTPGDYFNDAGGAAAGGYTVLSTGPTAKITVTAAPTADLSVSKVDSPDPVEVDQELTYTITVSNAGPDPAQNVMLSDTLPGTVTFVSVSFSQGSCTGTSTITCNLGTIAVMGLATVTIKVTPTTDADLTNTAMVSSAIADPNQANNSDTETTVVNAAPTGPMCNGLAATFVGGPGNDYFQGGRGVDVVVDPGGDNYLQTGGGDDHICLGNGDDEVDSGDGNDFVDAGGGKNKVKTGNGDDSVRSGTGDDEIDTGNGADLAVDLGGKNKINTGNEPDVVTADSGDDEIDTGDGDDVVVAGDGNNEVKAGNGNDQITTGAGNDKIDGGNGLDVCNPGGGSNEVKDCEVGPLPD